jgi:methylenetetrahydrofolate reductase (NADPH)
MCKKGGLVTTRSFSLEFFPPRSSDTQAQFDAALAELGELAPDYFSVTFGAGGTTQEGTPEAIGAILAAGHEAAPHISCIGTRSSDIRALLERYAAMGVRRLVALRGDLPSGHRDLGDFRHADELVRFIRNETGDRFHVEVAGYPEFHPESRSPGDDLRHFAAKVAAGADGVITQYFYNLDAYLRFVDEARALGVDVPIVPGVMPITNYRQLARFSDRCGAELPRSVTRLSQIWRIACSTPVRPACTCIHSIAPHRPCGSGTILASASAGPTEEDAYATAHFARRAAAPLGVGRPRNRRHHRAAQGVFRPQPRDFNRLRSDLRHVLEPRILSPQRAARQRALAHAVSSRFAHRRGAVGRPGDG